MSCEQLETFGQEGKGGRKDIMNVPSIFLTCCIAAASLIFGCTDTDREAPTAPEPPPAAVLTSPEDKTPETYDEAIEKQKTKQELQERAEDRKDL